MQTVRRPQQENAGRKLRDKVTQAAAEGVGGRLDEGVGRGMRAAVGSADKVPAGNRTGSDMVHIGHGPPPPSLFLLMPVSTLSTQTHYRQSEGMQRERRGLD